MQICVVGVGNPWASDDGVGPEVVRRLQAHVAAKNNRGQSPPAPVRFKTLPQADLSLLDLMPDCQVFILVDAVCSQSPPGTLHRLIWRPERLAARGVERTSSHGLGVKQLLELAAALDRLPPQVQVWGIEAATLAPGSGLSSLVAAALPTIVEELQQELKAIVTEG